MKKHIAFVVRNLNGGGVERTLINLINSIDKDVEISLYLFENIGMFKGQFTRPLTIIDLYNENIYFGRICYKSKGKFYELLKQGKFISAIKVFLFEKYCKRINKKKGVSAMYQKYLKKIKKDKVRYDLAIDFYGYGDFTTVFVAERLDAKYKITWLHDECQPWLQNIRTYYQKFDYIYACSHECKENFDIVFPDLQSRSKVFYNIIPVKKILEKANEFYPTEFKGIREVKLVSVGRAVAQKGYDMAIQAAIRLKQEHVEFKWYFLGNGELLEEFKEQVKRAGMESEIIFLGFCINPYPYIKHCDIYVQPSRHEGYCTTITEARILKKTIIATKVSGVYDQIKDRITGRIVAISAEEIATSLKELINNKRLLSEYENELLKDSVDFYSELEKLYSLI